MPEKLDSYECLKCGDYSHHAVSDPDNAKYCPYCGAHALEWRGDNLWGLVEIPDDPVITLPREQ